MRRRLAALVLAGAALLVACVAPQPTGPTPAPTREPATVTVTALLDLSGGQSSLGAAQRDALQLYTDTQASNQQVKLRWKSIDVAGSESRLLIELRRASVDDRVDAVIVGTPLTFYSPQLLQALTLAAVPVLLTQPAPRPALPGGRWLFTLAPAPEELSALVTADLATRGIGAPLRLEPREAEAITSALTLQGVRAVVLTGTPREYPRFGALLRSLAVKPLVYLSALTDPAELEAFRDTSLQTYWPGSLNVVGGSLIGPTTARRDFVRLLGDKRGPAPTSAATAYDGLTLIMSAAQNNWSGGPAGLRDRLELTNAIGIASTYTLDGTRHAGARIEDYGLLRWGGSFVVAGSAAR